MKNKSHLLLLAVLFFPLALWAQVPEITETDRLQGYVYDEPMAHFIFDSAVYNLDEEPGRVVVTGAFRGWSTDMDDTEWNLKKEKNSSLWILSVENPELEVISASSPFKFRINDGLWLDPPAGAENNDGGNLAFLHNITPPNLTAEIRDKYTIWAWISGVERSLNPAEYKLTTHSGEEIKIADVYPNTADQTLISLSEPIDITRVHQLEIESQGLLADLRYDGWFRELYSDKALGAEVDVENGTTSIRLFAPRATNVRLMLYDDKTGPASDSVNMVLGDRGVWDFFSNENLKGTWYDFKVFGPDEPGNHFYGTINETVSDPYSRVNDGAWGRSRVWTATEPATPLENGIPPMEDVVAYEVHVQDFTDQLPVDDSQKGTFTGMIESGLTNSKGEPVGFDYLVDLGVNVVHLMPVQEYLHYPDEEWKATFSDDPFMRKHGIAEENYQWGYRTTHAMAVENRYRTKGSENGAEREQFKELVQAFHDKGIAVIIDIVPNHTGENMDVVNYYFNFNGIDKVYYYRTKGFEHIGEYGNEVKTENRPMVQRWLIDQCLYYINEFGIDGFRIDLAGQVDEQTLKAIKKALGDDKIVYGEPWIASSDPEYENNPDWDWYKVDSPITFFQDDARNAFKGSAFFNADNPNKQEERGYSGGFLTQRENVALALQNYFPEEDSPLDGINYLDIHDNWALADQFAENNWDGRKGVLEDRVKIATALLFTSQGPLVLHGGTEILRSKGHAELKETVKEMPSGRKIYIHGKRDTYNMRVPNQFVWENVGLEKGEEGSSNDYKGMHAFWKGLIDFRLSEVGKIFRNAETIPESYYQFIMPENRAKLGYVVDEKVMVLINAGDEKVTFKDLNFPAGEWTLIGSLDGVDHKNGVKHDTHSALKGDRSHTIKMDPTSFFMWMKK
jgi:pullulanase/glycogen debranching enzyme